MKNKVYVIGMGPGAADAMSVKADRTLQECDTIIGYTVYVNLLKETYPEKEYLTTPMTQEAKRCEMAFEEAEKGKKVAMVCSGDAGVYPDAGNRSRSSRSGSRSNSWCYGCIKRRSGTWCTTDA